MSVSRKWPAFPETPRQPVAASERLPRARASSSSWISVEGVTFVSLTMLIGLAAINTGANLLYLVLSMMLAMLVLSGVIARNNLRRLSTRRVYPLEFHAGQDIAGLVEIHNGKRLFQSYAIGIEDAILGPVREGRKPKEALVLRSFALMVPPRHRASCPVQINLAARGLYTMRQIRIVSRFPFGFFEKMLRQEETGQILVYPRLLPTLAVLSHCPQAIGELSLDQKGMGTTLFDIRDYQPGDPSRHIHWKLSAKGQGLKVKEFEREESHSYCLMLDLRCPAKPSPALLADLEKAISVTATLARLLLRQGALVGLWTSAGNVPLASGPHHLQRLMRALAQVGPMPPDTPPVFPDAANRDVTQLWIEYQPADDRPARAGTVVRRAARWHVIDARKIADEPEPAVRRPSHAA